MTEPVTTQTATIWIDDDGIVHIESTGKTSTPETVIETLSAIESMLEGGRAPVLFDARRWQSGSVASWVTFIGLIEKVCLAGAVLVDPRSPADLGQYPDFLSRLLVPFAIFTAENDAVAFLEPHLGGTP